MKVGLIVPGFSADADDWCIPVLVDVVRELSRRVDLHVFALRYPYRRARYQLHGAQVHALGGGQRRGLRRASLLAGAYAALLGESRRGRFDVLHGLWADEPGLIAVTAGKLLRTPSVVSVMGGELVSLPDIAYGGRLALSGRALSSVSLRAATRVSAGCTHGIELAKRLLPPGHQDKVMRLVWGIDPLVFEPRETGSRLTGSLRVLHVGSLISVKDQTTLLRALARRRASDPEVHLHIAGEGPLRSTLTQQVASFGLSASVTFHGHVPRHELHAYYQAADVLALSSRYEAQCVAVLEAGLSGLPVVGTAVGLVADFAPHAAIAVPVGDDAALADGLALLRQIEVRRRLGSEARSLVCSEYLASHTADRLVELYDHLIQHRDRLCLNSPTPTVR